MSALPSIARYRTVQLKTSSPADLLLLLYDGLLRFIGEARVAMVKGDRAVTGERISRAHAILDELSATLNPKADAVLCERLFALYQFSMSRLLDANMKQTPDLLDEVIRVLSPLRDAWRVAAESNRMAAAG